MTDFIQSAEAVSEFCEEEERPGEGGCIAVLWAIMWPILAVGGVALYCTWW